MVKARNIIVVTGKIKAIRENRQSATIIIENQGEKVTSYPIFSVYDTDLIRGFRVNMRVQITAHAENRKSIDFDDSVTYIKDFVVDKMERQKRMLAPYLLNEKISESAQAEEEKNKKYTNGSVRGFTSPRWTLEYCIALS